MAEIKISDLTAKGANLDTTDLLIISEDDGAGGYVSKYITGAEITAVSAESIYLQDGTIRGDRTLDLSGAFVLFTNGSNNILKLNPSTNDITFNNEYTFPTADGSAMNVLMTDGSGALSFGVPSPGLYSQTVQSATVTNTTTETTIVGTGVGSLTVPANTFAVGDSYHAKIGGVLSAQNGDDITIRVKSGSTVLATTGALDLEATTSMAWECEIDFTIATVGASGSICTNGNFAYNRNTGTLEGYVFQDVVTFDTTVDNTLDITVEWAQAKTQDEIYSANFVLHKTY
jgi:hypothetical protein